MVEIIKWRAERWIDLRPPPLEGVSTVCEALEDDKAKSRYPIVFFFKKIQTITLSKSTDKFCWCWEHRKLNQKKKEETCDRCSESGEVISAEDDGFASFYALIIEGWKKEPNRVSQKTINQWRMYRIWHVLSLKQSDARNRITLVPWWLVIIIWSLPHTCGLLTLQWHWPSSALFVSLWLEWFNPLNFTMFLKLGPWAISFYSCILW